MTGRKLCGRTAILWLGTGAVGYIGVSLFLLESYKSLLPASPSASNLSAYRVPKNNVSTVSPFGMDPQSEASRGTEVTPGRLLYPHFRAQKQVQWAVMVATGDEKVPSTVGALLGIGWNVVVVGTNASDEGSSEWKLIYDPGYVYLSLEDQRSLHFKSVAFSLCHNPSKSAQKTIGYLYAMQRGAHVILDLSPSLGAVHDASAPSVDKATADFLWLIVNEHEKGSGSFQRPLLRGENLVGIPVEDEPIMWTPWLSADAAAAMNSAQRVPSGSKTFSKHDLKQRHTAHPATIQQTCKPIVQHFAVRFQPIFSLHSVMTKLVLPRNIFFPYDDRATLHLKDAFWALLPPEGPDPNAAYLIRAFVAQSLYHFLPNRACAMSISVKMAPHRRAAFGTKLQDDSRIGSSDRTFSEGLKQNMTDLVSIVRNHPWKVSTFQQALLGAYGLLVDSGYLGKQDLARLEAWIHDFENIGQAFPRLPAKTSTFWTQENTQLCLMFNDATYARQTAPDLVSKYLPLFDNVVLALDDVSDSGDGLDGAAGAQLRAGRALTRSPQQVDDAQLLFPQNWPRQVKAVYCNSSSGYYQNRCLLQCINAARFDQAVLFMADDDYLDFSKVENEKFPTDKIWFPPVTHHNGTIHNKTLFDAHMWSFRNQLVRSMKALKTLPRNLTRRYLDHISHSGQVEGNGMGDFVYIPPSLKQRVAEAIRGIETVTPALMTEVAMPLAMNLVAPGSERHEIRSVAFLWAWERFIRKMVVDWIENSVLFHPLKLSVPMHRAIWRDLMAEQYWKIDRGRRVRLHQQQINGSTSDRQPS